LFFVKYLCATKLTELEKIKVGIVNYLNTKPLLYGLQQPPINQKIDLVGHYPAKIAGMLVEGSIELGLVPVAILPTLPQATVVGNYCIGTEGEIASVALFSEVPLKEIETVYLDYQSRTSVALLKYLMREYWGINPQIIETANEDYRTKIKGTTAGLVIGDRAFEQRKVSSYIFDLGLEWKALTGLPFVFAVWVSTQPLTAQFLDEFDKANELGLQHINEIVAAHPFGLYDLKKYYNLHLSYQLDDRKRAAMHKFLALI
jgi:chorismate dehydratase